VHGVDLLQPENGSADLGRLVAIAPQRQLQNAALDFAFFVPGECGRRHHATILSGALSVNLAPRVDWPKRRRIFAAGRVGVTGMPASEYALRISSRMPQFANRHSKASTIAWLAASSSALSAFFNFD